MRYDDPATIPPDCINVLSLFQRQNTRTVSSFFFFFFFFFFSVFLPDVCVRPEPVLVNQSFSEFN
jgi:hypothetical protein